MLKKKEYLKKEKLVLSCLTVSCSIIRNCTVDCFVQPERSGSRTQIPFQHCCFPVLDLVPVACDIRAVDSGFPLCFILVLSGCATKIIYKGEKKRIGHYGADSEIMQNPFPAVLTSGLLSACIQWHEVYTLAHSRFAFRKPSPLSVWSLEMSSFAGASVSRGYGTVWLGNRSEVQLEPERFLSPFHGLITFPRQDGLQVFRADARYDTREALTLIFYSPDTSQQRTDRFPYANQYFKRIIIPNPVMQLSL